MPVSEDVYFFMWKPQPQNKFYNIYEDVINLCHLSPGIAGDFMPDTYPEGMYLA